MSYEPGPDSYPPPPPPGATPYGYGDERPAPQRPGTLLAGCIMTWIGSAFGLLIGLVFIVLSNSADLLDQLPSDVNRTDASTVFQVVGVLLIVWCLLSLLFSILAFVGKRWAAIVLVVLGGLWVALSLFGAVSGGGQGLISVVYVGAASALILVGSKEWFDYKAGKTASY